MNAVRNKDYSLKAKMNQVGGQSYAYKESVMKKVRSSDVTIEYRVDGKGPLILIIASTGRGTEEFGVLAKRLAERGYRVLRPEPRGIGGSKGPMENVTFHDFANDFATVIKSEGGGPAILVGHAYGNWIARTIASDHPDLTRGVVLVAAGAKSWPKELSQAITMINDPSSTREQRLVGLKLAFFAKGSDPTPWLEGWYADVTKSQREARKLTNMNDWWAGGSSPILDLLGGSDPFRPKSSHQELKDEFGDRVTVRIVPGTSHAMPVERPEEVAESIADWADQLKK
ncbi:alpha/beta fold hydrolase [Thermodesulfobacteriota bacterium]